jgi:hypothetical protein
MGRSLRRFRFVAWVGWELEFWVFASVGLLLHTYGLMGGRRETEWSGVEWNGVERRNEETGKWGNGEHT